MFDGLHSYEKDFSTFFTDPICRGNRVYKVGTGRSVRECRNEFKLGNTLYNVHQASMFERVRLCVCFCVCLCASSSRGGLAHVEFGSWDWFLIFSRLPRCAHLLFVAHFPCFGCFCRWVFWGFFFIFLSFLSFFIPPFCLADDSFYGAFLSRKNHHDTVG